MPNDDAEIVQRVIAGSVNDYRVLVERHQDAIYRFIQSLVSHRHEAEDLTQDVFLASYKNLASFDPDRALFATWLFTIARNRAINFLKRGRSPSGIESMPEPIDVHPPADAVEESEFLEQLDDCMNALPLEWMDRSRLRRVAACIGALLVGSVPLVYLAYISQVFIF